MLQWVVVVEDKTPKLLATLLLDEEREQH